MFGLTRGGERRGKMLGVVYLEEKDEAKLIPFGYLRL